jgi:predicted ATPase
MVGREEEVQVLLRHWRDAKSGEMRVVLVTGEPGIGKSRLAAALQDRLGAEQYICFRFFSSPHRQDNAFYPIIRHLEAAAGFELNDTAETRQAKLSALLAPAALSGQDLLLLAELVGLPPQSGLEQIKASPRLKREMMFDALIRQFDARSSQVRY